MIKGQVIFIATYVVFFILLNFINMFFTAINPRVGKYLEQEEQLLAGAIYAPEDPESETDYK